MRQPNAFRVIPRNQVSLSHTCSTNNISRPFIDVYTQTVIASSLQPTGVGPDKVPVDHVASPADDDANTLITRHQLSRLVLSKPDKGKIQRFERELKAKKLAAIRADKERREIERLLASQKSLLDNVLEDEGFDAFGGGNDDPVMADLGATDAVSELDKAVEMVLSGEMSAEEMVRKQFANAEAMDLQQWIKKQKLDRGGLEKVLLPIKPVRPVEAMDPNEAVAMLLLDPAFQLK